LNRSQRSFSFFSVLFSIVLLYSSILCVHAFVQTSIVPCQRAARLWPQRRQITSTKLFEANDCSKGDEHSQQQGLGALPGPEDTNEENIRSLFALFNNALATYVGNSYFDV
jgi:hypothetical protein